MTAPIKAF